MLNNAPIIQHLKPGYNGTIVDIKMMMTEERSSLIRQCILDYLANAHRSQGNTCCALVEVVDHVVRSHDNHIQCDMWAVRKAISKLRHEGKIVISTRPIPLIALKHLMENDKFVYMTLQHYSMSNLAYGKGLLVSAVASDANETLQYALLKMFREPGPMVALHGDPNANAYFRLTATTIALSNGNRVAVVKRQEGNNAFVISYLEEQQDHGQLRAPLVVFMTDTDHMRTTDLYQIILQLPTYDVKMVFLVDSSCMTNESSFITDLCKSRMIGHAALDHMCSMSAMSDATTEKDARYGLFAFIDDLKNEKSSTWIRNIDLNVCEDTKDLVYTEVESDDNIWDYASQEGKSTIVCCDALAGIATGTGGGSLDHADRTGDNVFVASNAEQLANHVNKLVSSLLTEEVQICIMETFGQIALSEWYSIIVKLPPKRLHIVTTQDVCYRQFSAASMPMPYTCLRKFLVQNSYEYQEQ